MKRLSFLKVILPVSLLIVAFCFPVWAADVLRSVSLAL